MSKRRTRPSDEGPGLFDKLQPALDVANGCDCRYPFDNSNCADCGLDTIEAGEWYGVHDEIWLQAWDHISRLPGQQILCTGCLEKRIGRRLTPRDFTDAPTNDPHRDSFVSDRMFERLVFPTGRRG
jgi:hypothetical protein